MSIAKLTKENNRLKVLLAIEKDRVEGLEMSVQFYKGAFMDEFKRTTPLTPSRTSLKVRGHANEGGINLPHKEAK